VNAIKRYTDIARRKGAGATICQSVTKGHANCAKYTNDRLKFGGACPCAAENPVVAGDPVGLGWNDHQIEVEHSQTRPQLCKFAIETDDHGNPQAVPFYYIDRFSVDGDAVGALLFERSQAKLALAVTRTVWR
tara:strand:+ start:1207 stop:1605 length:399 start_codon:yes stop_codon:yes gene_type:complete